MYSSDVRQTWMGHVLLRYNVLFPAQSGMPLSRARERPASRVEHPHLKSEMLHYSSSPLPHEIGRPFEAALEYHAIVASMAIQPRHHLSTLHLASAMSLSLTHSDWNNSINVYLWLPESNWNSRLQGIGGGGFSGLQNFWGLETDIYNNSSAVGTDTGHIMSSETASSWALDSSGKVNLGLLEDFAAVAFNDAALIAKSIVQSYLGTAPNKICWNGCSTGARQGLKMAQRYPQIYDGIAANAPAINWARFIVAECWLQFTVNQLKSYPPQCVFNTITNATIAACDKIDGLAEGTISAPGLCAFDPHTLVGQTVECGNFTTSITDNDATIAARTWQGPVSSANDNMWYGLLPGAPFIGLASTTCSGTKCTGNSFPIPPSWIDYFVLQMPDFDLSSINQSTYETI